MHWTGHAARLLAVLAALVLAAGLATPAAALDQHTPWYTIDFAPPTDAYPPLYLTVTSDGVRLERYRSGDPTQHWIPVQPDYPTAPAVTGAGPIDGMFENCILGFNGGCAFAGNAGRMRVKLLNRASGQCLYFEPVGSASFATLYPCTNNEPSRTIQLWMPRQPATDQRYTSLSAPNFSRQECIGVERREPGNQLDSRLVAGQCGGGWYQNLRFLPAADVPCTTTFGWQLCFYDGQRY